MFAVAPRVWDSGLQSLNARFATGEKQRLQEDFVAKLDKLICHLNTTAHATPERRSRRKSMCGPPETEVQGLTRGARKERKKLVHQLVTQKKELELLQPAEAETLIASLRGLLSDPTILSQVGLADPSIQARLRAKEQVRNKAIQNQRAGK